MLRIIAQIIQCNTFFCNSSSLPVWASLLQNGWYCVTIFVYKEGQSLCDNIFVYEMSPVQQSFSGDAENDKARFLAICCSFSKPCCLPLPDFANLRELFLALARLCCLSRLLPLFPTFPSGLAVRRASFRNPSIAACLSYVFQLFLGNC